MARLNWFSSEVTGRSISGTIRQASSKGKQTTAVIVGLLMATSLLGIGCSKGNKQAAANNQNRSTPSSTTQAAPVASPLPAVASQPTPPKKTVKKRPSTVTYAEPNYGVSFQYPRKYTLKTGDAAHVELDGSGPVAMNFVQPGGMSVATVEVPHSFYPNTDLTSAFFHVSVNKDMTSEECGQFAFPSHLETEPIPPSKVKVGETEFAEVDNFGPMKLADAKYYHLFENGACYEFALGLGTTGDEMEDGVKPVDRKAVFGKLEKILASVKVKPEKAKPETTPEVATGTPTAPASQEPVAK